MEQILYHLADRDIFKIKVAGKQHFLFLAVHNAGRADPHRLHLVHPDARCLRSVLSGLRHGLGDFLSRTAHAGLVACFGQQLELLVHHARDDVSAAQVDADIIFHTKTPLHFVVLPAGRLLFY